MNARNRKIMNMYHEQFTYSEIAKSLGITRNAVAGAIDRNKDKSPKLSFEERMKKHLQSI